MRDVLFSRRKETAFQSAGHIHIMRDSNFAPTQRRLGRPWGRVTSRSASRNLFPCSSQDTTVASSGCVPCSKSLAQHSIEALTV